MAAHFSGAFSIVQRVLGSAFVGLRGLLICSISMRPPSAFAWVPSAFATSLNAPGSPAARAFAIVQVQRSIAVGGKPSFFPAVPLRITLSN